MSLLQRQHENSIYPTTGPLYISSSSLNTIFLIKTVSFLKSQPKKDVVANTISFLEEPLKLQIQLLIELKSELNHITILICLPETYFKSRNKNVFSFSSSYQFILKFDNLLVITTFGNKS